MGLTLSDIKKKIAEQQERANRPEVNWFSLKGKKSPVLIQFLQELDEDSPTYDSSRGKVLFLVEHTSPYDFKRRGECSLESQGRCFPCEMNIDQPTLVIDEDEINHPWSQKTNMYIYVLTEAGKVEVLSRSAYSSFVERLMDYSEDEGEGSITGRTFKITKGTAKNAPWELATTKQEIDVPEIPELVDLELAVGRKIDYDKQRNFYIPKPKEESVVTTKESSKSSVDADW